MAPKHLRQWIWQGPDWPEFSWDLERLAQSLAMARRAQGEVLGMAKLLGADNDLSAQLEVLTAEGAATSAIEGERFDPNALRSSLARRLGLPSAKLPSSPRSVEGLVDVLMDATRDPAMPLTLDRLCGWQAALFPTGRSGLTKIRVGELRGKAPMQIVSGPAGRRRVHYEAPPRAVLNRNMKLFLAWFNAPPKGLDGLLRAGIAHAWFELLHPFEDGNGRVGRAVLDRALAQDEGRPSRLYSLSARFMAVRDEYYTALEQLSKSSLDATDWLQWFLEQLAAACRSSEQTVERVLYKARFWIRHGQAAINDRQRKAINLMLDAGAEGFAGGMTNRKYAHLNRVSAATAQRDLAELAQLGVLTAAGGGRGLRYNFSGVPSSFIDNLGPPPGVEDVELEIPP